MGACIESVATVRTHRGPLGRGTRSLSDAAARACLSRAHDRPGEVELLVNAGVYKDKSMAEPALASIIQEDIGANPGHPAREGAHGTFSFDVLGGGCGALSAAFVVDAFVGPGTAERGMVVAGDVDPWPHTSRDFPFARVAGAMLLRHEDGAAGFERFAFRTFPEHAGLFTSFVHWDAASRRNVLEVHEDPELARVVVPLAASAARGLLGDAGVALDEIDLLIVSQHPTTFAADLARTLGVPEERLPRVREDRANAHTAGPLAALEAAIDQGLFARARRILFVTAGAGVTIAAALYRSA